MPLAAMDYVPGINYPGAIVYLPLKPGASPTKLFAHLQEGLHRTFVQVPWLNGKVYRQSEKAPDWRPGRLEVRYTPIPVDGPPPHQFRFKELEETTTYEDIKAGGFSLQTFQDEELLWAEIYVNISSSVGTEVFAAQANFLPGVCILSFALLHSVGDAAATTTIVRLWADHCRSISSETPGPSFSRESWDRTTLETVWQTEGKEKARRPQGELDITTWHMVGLDPYSAVASAQALKPRPTPKVRSMKSRMFYISPAAFRALRKATDDAGGELGSDTTDISGNDILIALIWRAVVKARTQAAVIAATADDGNPDSLAELVVTTDGRFNFSQTGAVSPDYLGNIVFHHRPAAPLRSLTAPDSTMPAVARLVRDSGRVINHQTMMEGYQLLRECPNYGLVRREHPTRMLVSSMLMFSADLEFGDARGLLAGGGRPESYRYLTTVRDSYCFPCCFIMPRKAYGGIEFMATLFDEELDLLLKDKEFSRYVYLLS